LFVLVPELGIMVKSMSAALRSVSSTMILAMLVTYVWGIVLTLWAKGKPAFTGQQREIALKEQQASGGGDQVPDVDDTNFFGSLGWSCLSLVSLLVYDDAFSLIRQVMIESKLMGLLLILFIVIGAFTVLNMLIGVICEIVSSTKIEEEEKMLMEKIQNLFAEMDEDGSGNLTRSEFEAKIALLRRLGLNEDVCKLAFDLIDRDGSGTLSMSEFLDVTLRLLHPPASQDLLKIGRNVLSLCDRLGVDGFETNKVPGKKSPATALTIGSVKLKRAATTGAATSVSNALNNRSHNVVNEIVEEVGQALDHSELVESIHRCEASLAEIKLHISRSV